MEDCGEAWLLHRYDLIQSLAHWRGRKDRSFFVLDDQNKWLAIVPLHLVTNSKAAFLRLHTLVSQGGPAIIDNIDKEYRDKIFNFIGDCLIKMAVEVGAMQIELNFSSMSPGIHSIPQGFVDVVEQTYVLDLHGGAEAVWNRMEKRARTAIRKAEKEQVIIRRANLNTDLDIYYHLHQTTYHRTGASPHPKAYFEHIWQDFYQKGLSLILFAELEGEVVAAANFGIYKNRAMYWTGASTDKGLQSNANSLLQWRAIQEFIELGVELFESGRAFPNATGKLGGLDKFKRSFGGELVPQHKLRVVTRPWLSALFTAYKRFPVGKQ